MKEHHTVVVAGAGPAGSAAAYTLARRGIDVCLVDKAVFPRDKLCGGLLTHRSRKLFAKIFGADWSGVFEYQTQGAKIFSRHALINRIEHHDGLFFTRRIVFDAHLLGLAQSAGATSRLGDGIAAIDIASRACRLRSGTEIAYDYLIGADGVNSVVAKTLFGTSFDPGRVGFALETEVDRWAVGRDDAVPEVHFGIVRWGYGWVFPKRDTITVGIGGWHARNPRMKETFNGFLRDLFGDIPPGRIRGHHIPFGDYRRKPGAGNILLAGDAAGLVEPITGEGIAFAMQSGHLAACSIADRLGTEGNTRVLEIYTDRFAEIAQALDYGNRLRYLIFPKLSEPLFIKALARSRQLPLKHLELMADEITYPDYAKFLAATTLKSLARRALFLK